MWFLPGKFHGGGYEVTKSDMIRWLLTVNSHEWRIVLGVPGGVPGVPLYVHSLFSDRDKWVTLFLPSISVKRADDVTRINPGDQLSPSSFHHIHLLHKWIAHVDKSKVIETSSEPDFRDRFSSLYYFKKFCSFLLFKLPERLQCRKVPLVAVAEQFWRLEKRFVVTAEKFV